MMTASQSHLSPFRASRLVFTLLLAGTLAGCGKKVPEGQVVAVVNGEEVTRRDLAAEPQAGAPAGGDGSPGALGPVLNGVIDRKLAAAEAKRLELDRTPQYVAQVKRLDEVMLSRTLFDRWAAQMPQPDQRTIAAYIARNPQRFDGRKLFLVDQIQAALDEGQHAALAPLQSNDAIAGYLDGRSTPYRRTRTVMDSATLTPALYRQLQALTPGAPLALVQDGQVTILAVMETRDAPLAPADRQAAANTALKQEAVQQKLASLRKTAEIAYQPGYRPDGSGKSTAQKKAAPAQ
jgi:EpsD family peptidyl-prolyl cis-trans isomerase